MARERFCKVCGGWHDLNEPWPSECFIAPPSKRSSLAAPMLISDTMNPVKSMLDGKMYDSKAQLRATYKAAGVVELGNEKQKEFKPKRPSRKKIRESIDKGFSRAGLGA